MSYKVATVVVTYNRSKMLKECIASLLNQSHAIIKIYVVDNNSNDGTKEYLNEIAAKDPRICPILLEQNLGGSGGFYIGMKKAAESSIDFDWIWVMDDDSEPKSDCLNQLLEFSTNSETQLGFISPKIVNKNSGQLENYHHKVINRFLTKDNSISKAEVNANNPIEINANGFVGPLISMTALKKVGYPHKDFFIYLDDAEYTYRVSRLFKCYLVPAATIYHKDKISEKSTVQDFWKDCYEMRNRLVWIHSSLKGINKTISMGWMIIFLFRKIVKINIQNQWSNNRVYCLKLLFKAYNQGMHNQMGIFILPNEYKKNLVKP